jgi:hypothetical protein
MLKHSGKSRKTAGRTRRLAASTAPKGYARYLAIVLNMPGTEQSTSYGTPAVKIKGKLLSRLRTEAEGSLALRCGILDRNILLQSDPESFFLTDHYHNYPWILVRLDKISKSSLTDVVQRAWQLLASKKHLDGRQRVNAMTKNRHS